MNDDVMFCAVRLMWWQIWGDAQWQWRGLHIKDNVKKTGSTQAFRTEMKSG